MMIRPAAAIAAAITCALGLHSSIASPRPLSSTTFEALFHQYLHGDADAAVRELATWPEARVEAEAAPVPEDADDWTRAARALFHTEAALLNETFAAKAHGAIFTGQYPLEAHARHALGLVEGLGPACAAETSVREFCVQWILFVCSFNRRVFSGR